MTGQVTFWIWTIGAVSMAFAQLLGNAANESGAKRSRYWIAIEAFFWPILLLKAIVVWLWRREK
jgi:hypothetical protein